MNMQRYTPRRSSPVEDALRTYPGIWREVYDMATLVAVAGGPEDNPLAIADLSCLPQWGVKGAGAATWLHQHDIPVPERPSSWCPSPAGGLVARLGMTEFAIQAGWDESYQHIALPNFVYTRGSPVYPVERQYLAIALWGAALPDLLRQTCNINFKVLNLTERPVVMTMMIGVGVTVLPGEQNGIPFYQVWGDRSYGLYLWQTLTAIAYELGGRVIGIDQIPNLKSKI